MTALLNWRLWAAAGVAVLLAWTHWQAYRQGGESARVDLAKYVADSEHQAELQRQANRSRSHDAEQAEVPRIVYRDRVITKTIERVRNATAPLASCPVPPVAVGMLNDAARCAREGRSPACPADGPMPRP